MKTKLNLQITEEAYYKLLDKCLPNGIPVLDYVEGVCTISKRESADISNAYQVGRLIMLIDDKGIIDQVSGKILDYESGDYIIREVK